YGLTAYRHCQYDQRAAFLGPEEFQRALQDLSALLHRHQAKASIGMLRHTNAAVLHLQLEAARAILDPHASGLRFRVAHHIIQALLQNTINVDRRLIADLRTASRSFISYNEPCLLSELGDVPLECLLQAVVVENGWMQRLREAAEALQQGLGDFAHLAH